MGDAVRRKIKYDKQPYYISPDQVIEGEFFYIAALFEEKRTLHGTSYSVVALTQSSDFDDKFIGYVQRIPLLLRRKDIKKWLDPKQRNINIFKAKQNIKPNAFRKIGLWINAQEEHKEEHIVLRSRFEWDLEKEAKLIGLDDEHFAFDEIEKEALRQNEANKLKETKRNWDHLKLREEDDENHEKEELKQEEYTKKTKKRKRSEFD